MLNVALEDNEDGCMIQVLLKNSSQIETLSIDDFSKQMGISWLNALEFQTDGYIQKILKQSKRAMRKKELSIRAKWLGVRYKQEVSNGYMPKISIRYIDEHFGYGGFAEEDIAVGAYIGEYTGIVRKRRWRKDRKNDYCFEYTIGDWVYNPFIIDAKGKGNFTRYINHSEDPNVESLSVYVDEVMHIIFVALKPIKAGSQMCYHYGDTFWKKRRHNEKLVITGS